MSSLASGSFWTMQNAYHVKAEDGSLLPFNLANPTTEGGEATYSAMHACAAPASKAKSAPGRLGDVGYLEPWTQRFVVLFNAFDPARTGARATLRTARPATDALFRPPRKFLDSLLARARETGPTTTTTQQGRFRLVQLEGPELHAWLEYYIYEILHVYAASEHWLWGPESIMIRTGGVQILHGDALDAEGAETPSTTLDCERYAVDVLGKLVWPREWEFDSEESLLEPSSN